LKYRLIITFIFICCLQKNFAQQFRLYGTVYDYFSKKPLDAVSVFSSSGKITISDSLGKYSILVSRKDSVWFSYLNKSTMKYPVDTISNPQNFEIALYVDVAWLPEIKVRSSDYKLDSIRNRQDYAKIFNYKKPGLKLSETPPSSYVPGSVTVGLDLDELINVFRFRRNRRLASFQERLLTQEQDKYIDHRFTKLFVRQLTKLDAAELDSFMVYYRPEYFMLIQMNDLELGYYIIQCYKQYLNFGKGGTLWRRSDDN
jgi:hypothetical protein